MHSTLIAAGIVVLVSTTMVSCNAPVKQGPAQQALSGSVEKRYKTEARISRVEKGSAPHLLSTIQAVSLEGECAAVTVEEDNIQIIMETIIQPHGLMETQFQFAKLVTDKEPIVLAKPRILHKAGQKAAITVELEGQEYRFEISTCLLSPGTT